jgi:hypothetical protein
MHSSHGLNGLFLTWEKNIKGVSVLYAIRAILFFSKISSG